MLKDWTFGDSTQAIQATPAPQMGCFDQIIGKEEDILLLVPETFVSTDMIQTGFVIMVMIHDGMSYASKEHKCSKLEFGTTPHIFIATCATSFQFGPFLEFRTCVQSFQLTLPCKSFGDRCSFQNWAEPSCSHLVIAIQTHLLCLSAPTPVEHPVFARQKCHYAEQHCMPCQFTPKSFIIIHNIIYTMYL